MDLYLYDATGNTFLVGKQKRPRKEYLSLMNAYQVDGFILYEDNPLKMTIYNRDGSEATMCGNGLRCFLNYGLKKSDLSKGKYEIITKAGKIKTTIDEISPFCCTIHFLPDPRMIIRKNIVMVDGDSFPIYTIFLGTLSHICIYTSPTLNPERIIVRLQELFGKKNIGNISFVHLLNREEFEILTYERGVGFTASCGTANAAAFYLLKTKNYVDNNVQGKNRGGTLFLSYKKPYILLSGEVILKGKFEG